MFILKKKLKSILKLDYIPLGRPDSGTEFGTNKTGFELKPDSEPEPFLRKWSRSGSKSTMVSIQKCSFSNPLADKYS